jgi:hypothetical protein
MHVSVIRTPLTICWVCWMHTLPNCFCLLTTLQAVFSHSSGGSELSVIAFGAGILCGQEGAIVQWKNWYGDLGLPRRYVVKELVGQGTFGQVARCYTTETNMNVAVKIIKNQLAYYTQAKVEIGILHVVWFALLYGSILFSQDPKIWSWIFG